MSDDFITARSAEHSVARWTIASLCACVALNAIGIVAARPATVGMLQIVGGVCTAVAWLRWLHRAYCNLALVGSKRATFTPGRAVGFWFIPFVNLVRPYQVVKDLWLRSASLNDRDAYDDLPAPAFVTGWWGCLVVYVLSSVARDARSPVDLAAITEAGVAVDAIGIVAAALAVRVVWGIDLYQQQFAGWIPLPDARP